MGDVVERGPVAVHHLGEVGRAFGPAFEFDGRDFHARQPFQVVEQAEVFGCEEFGPAVGVQRHGQGRVGNGAGLGLVVAKRSKGEVLVRGVEGEFVSRLRAVFANFPERLPGPGALLEGDGRGPVFVPAGMGALAEVAGPVVEQGGHVAAAGHGHAHGSVHEDFKLHGGHLLAHGFQHLDQFAGPQFAGYVDALGPGLAPEPDRFAVGGVGLG